MRKLSKSHGLLILAALLLTVLLAGSAGGEPNLEAKRIVDSTKLFDAAVTVKLRGQLRRETISCLGKTPGISTEKNGALYFTPLTKLINKLQGRGGSKAEKQLELYRLLLPAGRRACSNPDFLSLAPYRGPFGKAEALILFNRFGFGAAPEQATRAAKKGLNRTIAELTALKSEPDLDALADDLICDGEIAGRDEDNAACDPTDPNDLYFPGVRYATYARFIYSQNQFFEKLFLFLHDERMAASSAALSGCSAYALLLHLDLLRRAARTGDYRRYLRDWNSDYLGHLEWLDGKNNRGYDPNENYGREFWELGTVGPTGLDGKPVYSDADIAQAALAFSGWNIDGYEINDRWICLAEYVPRLHASGPKLVFRGGRYQAAVENADDMIAAALAHPRTAESLAEDLWKEYLNPYATPAAVKALAAEIRRNDFNLLPVLRMMMKSQALFAERSRNSLIKHPLDLIIGFLRATGVPVDYDRLDDFLEDLGQQVLLPPTVFGWNETKLAGEAYVLAWRNTIVNILRQNTTELQEEYQYRFADRFLQNLGSEPEASLALVDRLTAWLGVRLTAAQRSRLNDYLNYDLEYCYNPAACGGERYRQVRDQFDPHPDNTGSEYKVRGALALLAELPEYRLK